MRTHPPGNAGEVFTAFLRLGLTAFGGPVAHLAYFREAFVARRKWLSEAEYADTVALCQFLPGPASSQVGMALGLQRAGWRGMLAAFAAFTLPSAILMLLFAGGAVFLGETLGSGWLTGLKAAAVAVVAQAVLAMAKTLAAEKIPAVLAAAAFALVLLVPGAFSQLLAILLGALAGLLLLRRSTPGEAGSTNASQRPALPVAVAVSALVVFAVLLLGLPVLAALTGNDALRLSEIFYRAGALVFGGGHVVLPLLEAQLVPTGLIDHDLFLAGYGAAQAVPGPLFTFSSYLGALSQDSLAPLVGAGLAVLAMFLPGALLVAGALPFWQRLRTWAPARRALIGVNAAVVGILGAALYDPVFTAGVTSAGTLALAVAAFVALHRLKLAPWLVVVGAAVLGQFFF
ncbi:chromate efflux transporter [Glutamicibacter endophyticus]